MYMHVTYLPVISPILVSLVGTIAFLCEYITDLANLHEIKKRILIILPTNFDF